MAAEPQNPFHCYDDATTAVVCINSGPPSPTLWIEIKDPDRASAAIIMTAAEARRFAARISALADIAEDRIRYAAVVAEDEAELDAAIASER